MPCASTRDDSLAGSAIRVPHSVWQRGSRPGLAAGPAMCQHANAPNGPETRSGGALGAPTAWVQHHQPMAPDQPVPAPDSDIRLTLPARPENVAVVRHVLGALAEALALPPALVDDVRLAVTEACTNVVRHAYEGEGS